MRNSFGEEIDLTYKPVAFDWQEQDLFLDDKVYRTEDGYVKVEDIQVYMDDKYGSIYMEDIIENLKGGID